MKNLNKNSNENFLIINSEEVKSALLAAIKADKKNGVQGAVYYESAIPNSDFLKVKDDATIEITDKNGNKIGESPAMDGFREGDVNCIDGYETYKNFEELYLYQGFYVSQKKDVVCGGFKLRMIVFTNIDQGKECGDYFGMAVGYVQNRNELVMYMHHHDAGKPSNKKCNSSIKVKMQKSPQSVNPCELFNKKEDTPNQATKNITVFIQGETDYIWFDYSIEELNFHLENSEINHYEISIQLAQLLDGDLYTELSMDKKAIVQVLLAQYVSKLDSYKTMLLTDCKSIMLTAFRTITGYSIRVAGLTKHNINDATLFVAGMPFKIPAQIILLLHFMKQTQHLYQEKYLPTSAFHRLMRQANQISGMIEFREQGNPNLN